ncbi:L-type lectin-domain containing receptor kinase IX.1-like [Tripterygium wilfordii]|uniref:L-type lectin-domain containing receptor kinase IX.1-like n=1 Tax=Tripterygium wilfordii TaxID=458696 RepID=UPI0018F82B95|nr:L-type lectin-domain containing receptor kinase IX.1-like [Tripterygium wilfordii]
MIAVNFMNSLDHQWHIINLITLFTTCSFLFLVLTPETVGSLIFNFSSFDSNHPEIVTDGHASVVVGTVQLTLNLRDRGQEGSSGRATYKESFHLWDKISGNLSSFNTHFTFVINSQENSIYGDGLTFFLAPCNFWCPSDFAVGGGLGLSSVAGNPFLKGLFPFVAVEFDTYSNDWDPPYDHVGINVNSFTSVKNVPWISSIPDGTSTEVWITYDSIKKNLSVEFAYVDKKSQKHSVGRISYEVDVREILPEWVTIGFSASTGIAFEINTICSWSFNSRSHILDSRLNESDPLREVRSPFSGSNPEPEERERTGITLVAWFGIGFCFLIVCMIFLHIRLRTKKMRQDENFNGFVFQVSFGDEFQNGLVPKKFSFIELTEATKYFAEDEKLGEGGFGAVYRGFSKDLNSYVAVKRISSASKQGTKEYASEVKIISRLRHKNLVKLLGWCHQKDLLLVYEFMPQGSLDTHLFKGKSLLTWVLRFKIVQGLALALFYLHEEGDLCVLHRDIKSSNIMLDSDFNAKLGDFGLARLVDHAKGCQTTMPAGTMGYMAPEYIMSGKASKATDVYSFGVVALEIASGRKAADARNAEEIRLVEWVWELHGTGNVLEAADPKLCREFDEEQVKRLILVGLWCVHPNHTFRPSTRQVINVLNFEAPLPTLPSQMPVLAYVTPSQEMDEMLGFLYSGDHDHHATHDNGVVAQTQNLNQENTPLYPHSFM